MPDTSTRSAIRPRRRRRKSSLEREVLVSVIALYVLICAALLAVHYLQPDGQGTTTSSGSPSHKSFSTEGEK